MSDTKTPRQHGEHHHRHHRLAPTGNSTLDRDTKRRQFQRAILILPAILFGLGLAVWYWGMNYNRAIQVPNDDLVQCGLWLMGICGGIFALLLITDWTKRISNAIRDASFQRQVRREMRRMNQRHHHNQEESGEKPADSSSNGAEDSGDARH